MLTANFWIEVLNVLMDRADDISDNPEWDFFYLAC